jgi:hypothetical protein
MRIRQTLYSIVSEAALAACCALAASLVVPTAYGAPFLLKTLIIFASVSALALSAAVRLSGRLWPLPCALFAGAVFAFAYIARERIAEGFKLLWYQAGSLLSLSFSALPTPEAPAPASSLEIPVTYFLILTAAVFVLIAVILLAKCRPVTPKLILPVPPFVLGFVYYDCRPAVYVIALLVIYWAGVIFGRERKRAGSKKAEPARLIFIALLALFALMIPKMIPESRFEPIPFEERRSFIDAIGSLRERLTTRRTGLPKVYDLSGEGERPDDSTKAFSINAGRLGPIYLRLHSYGLYSGSSWAAAEEPGGDWSSQKALGATQRGRASTLRIRDAYFSEKLTPYGFLPDYDGKVGESSIRARGQTAYVWTYRTGLHLSPASVPKAEDEYYEWALEHYTLPDGPIRDGLLDLLDSTYCWTAEGFISYDSYAPTALEMISDLDNYEAALLIASCVRGSAHYTRFPGITPEGEDFVLYFLKESRRGYCVHFASATTALLQAAGIPARYVVGYRFDVGLENTWTTVTKNSSHAWTEVYLEGVGWLPVESTASFSSFTGMIDLSPEPGAPTPTPSPAPAARPSSASTAAVSTPRPTAAPTEAPAVRRPLGAKKTALICALAFLAAVALWEAYGVYLRKRREKRFRQEDEKAAVLAMLGYLGKLEKYGARLPDEPDALANEAAFSNHDMEKERKELLRLVRSDQSRVLRASPFRRFILKFVTFRL